MSCEPSIFFQLILRETISGEAIAEYGLKSACINVGNIVANLNWNDR